MAFALLSLVAISASAGPRRGVVGQKAPSWDDLQWLNLPQEFKSLDVEDFAGKAIYVFCFQSWCPGCHSHGFPALQAVEEHYRDRDDVVFIAIQTVFEGFGTNTASRGLSSIEEYDLVIPLAHDEGEGGPGPFMRRYRTGGTPWTILIDPEGVVRWNGFQISPKQAIDLIDGWRPEQPEEGSPAGGEASMER